MGGQSSIDISQSFRKSNWVDCEGRVTCSAELGGQRAVRVCGEANLARTTSRVPAALTPAPLARALCLTPQHHGAAAHLRGDATPGDPRHQLGPAPCRRR